jgi:hypothetical protein
MGLSRHSEQALRSRSAYADSSKSCFGAGVAVATISHTQVLLEGQPLCSLFPNAASLAAGL